MSTPMSRIQSGIAYQTRPSGRPDANDRTATESVRRERSASRSDGATRIKALVSHGPHGYVHAQRVTLAPILVKVVPIVAFPLPAVRHVRVHADEDHQPVVVVEH